MDVLKAAKVTQFCPRHPKQKEWELLWAQSLRKRHSYLTVAPKDHRYSTTVESNFFQKDIPTSSQYKLWKTLLLTANCLNPSQKMCIIQDWISQISAPGFLCIFAGQNAIRDFQLALPSNAYFPILFPAVCKLLLILTWRSIICTHLKVIHSSPWRDQELCSQELQVQMWLRWDLRWFAGQNPGTTTILASGGPGFIQASSFNRKFSRVHILTTVLANFQLR